MDNNNFFNKIDEEEFLGLNKNERHIYTDKLDKSIYELYRQYQRGNLLLQPDFQRYEVWDNKKSSLLIESVLLDIPLPMIYLNEEVDGKYSVIDGQQRLTAFFNFLDNKLRLNHLVVLNELKGKKFNDLSEEIKNKFENASLRVIQIKKESTPEIKFEIFERLNTGSVQLNAQELRNCIYHGSYNTLLKELAKDKDFLYILGLDEPHKRMKDIELLLRFFAFQHRSYEEYLPPMKRFLNQEMERNRNLKDEKEMNLRKIFKKTVSLVKQIFKQNAFRRFVVGTKENPSGYYEKKINNGLFDILMWSFSLHNEEDILSNQDKIREELLWLMTFDEEFINAISGTGTDNRSKVLTRFSKWNNALNNLLKLSKINPNSFSLEQKKDLLDFQPNCIICGSLIDSVDDAVFLDVDFYWRKNHPFTTDAKLVHRYCKRNSYYSNLYQRNILIKQKSQLYKPKRVSGGLSRDFYRIPILEALIKLNGSATVREVLHYVEQKLKKYFTDIDWKIIPSGRYRWENNALWVRKELVDEGLLKKNSPHGIWEITEQGRKYYEDYLQRKNQT